MKKHTIKLTVSAWLLSALPLMAVLEHPKEFPAGSTDLAPANQKRLEEKLFPKVSSRPYLLPVKKDFDFKPLDIQTPTLDRLLNCPKCR